jgi:hypothetical protein
MVLVVQQLEKGKTLFGVLPHSLRIFDHLTAVKIV